MKSFNENAEDSSLEIRGKIKLKVTYEKVSSNLSLTIFSCENLASCSNKKETCDPYVKVYLLPGSKDKNNKRKTSTKKNTINPEYNETLRVRK
jgi:Ca2+-dependent lipid-binding protein